MNAPSQSQIKANNYHLSSVHLRLNYQLQCARDLRENRITFSFGSAPADALYLYPEEAGAMHLPNQEGTGLPPARRFSASQRSEASGASAERHSTQQRERRVALDTRRECGRDTDPSLLCRRHQGLTSQVSSASPPHLRCRHLPPNSALRQRTGQGLWHLCFFTGDNGHRTC